MDDNLDNAKIIEDALKETEVLDIEREEQEVPPPQQMQPQYEQQMPPQQYQQPPQQYQQQIPPQQYQQYPQQMPQQQYPMPPQQEYRQRPQILEEKNEPDSNILTQSPILKNLQHSIILFMLLILFNNTGFENFLSKIPFTINEDGNQTIFMYFIIFLLIFLVYFFYLNIFN